MGSLEKGTRTPKTDTKLVNKKSASGIISSQCWRPWVRETCCAAWKFKNWLCQEIVLPGSNYCFLITAFPLQLFLASLLYLGLPWWLIKFQSRWLCRAAGDFHLPGEAGFSLARLHGHCQLFVLAVVDSLFGFVWQHRDETWKSFSHSPCHCLGKQQAGYIYFVPPLSVPALFLVAKLSLGDRWYFKSQQSGVTFFHGCYSFPTLQIHLFLSHFSGIIVKNAQDSFTVLVIVWMRLCHLCRTTTAFTKKHLSEVWSMIQNGCCFSTGVNSWRNTAQILQVPLLGAEWFLSLLY